LKSGAFPVATAAPAFPFEKSVAHMALAARISREAPATDAVPPTPDNMTEGARLYREQCAVCHGLSGGTQTAIARGMYPPPPQLFKGKGVSDDPAGETYWKIANGIRLTGMPGFGKSLSETQMWQISQLLANSQKLPPAVSALVMADMQAK
jgi:thiosulfate dehydrogenase